MDEILTKDEVLKRALTRDRIGRSSGIYFLISGEEVVYIGQSLNVYARLRHHNGQRNKFEFDKFHYILCDANNLNELEKEYIHEFYPIYNVKKYWPSYRSRYMRVNMEDVEELDI